VSSDPERHAERVREVERLGATIVWLQNGSGAAPERVLLVCGEQVRPRSAERGSNR
jgi:coenzyme F420-dependent glucose-6-phosphate dehydrogenase